MYKFLFLISFLLVGAAPQNKDNRDRVIVIDTGITHSEEFDPYLCKDGVEDVVGIDGIDVNGHGTNVSNIIASYLDSTTQCIHSIKWYHDKEPTPDLAIIRLNKAYMLAMHVPNAKVINLSMSGGDPIEYEEEFLSKLSNLNINIVVAAGNDGLDLNISCNTYPACYKITKNMTVVGNARNGRRHAKSNYNGPVNRWEDGVDVEAGGYVMSGTSMSCAIASGKIMRGIKNVTP